MSLKRFASRAALVALIATALGGCCVLSPVVGICVPGGYGGGHGPGGGPRYLGQAQTSPIVLADARLGPRR